MPGELSIESAEPTSVDLRVYLMESAVPASRYASVRRAEPVPPAQSCEQ